MKAALAAALLGACVALPSGPDAGAGPAQAAQAAQAAHNEPEALQLLVMLPMPPPHLRAGAGYGGAYPLDAGAAGRRRVASELAREHGLRLVDSWPMPVIGVDCYLMERAPEVPAGPLLQALGRDPRVAWVQPVNAFRAQGPGGDPLYPIQPAATAWHLADLHRISTGRGVSVAVIDSGVDATHPELAGQVELQENFVEAGPAPAEAHGTAVAGVLAARADDGIGIAGVAPGARLMALRACWQTPDQGASCSSFTLGKALNYAIEHRARIINLSLAGPSDRLLTTLVEAAGRQGTAVVGAAALGGSDDAFPGSVPGVIAVAAQAPAPAPPRGGVLLAPGVDVPTCLPGARWGLVSGASYAAAHVSGLLALLAQLQPGASAPALKRDIVAAPAALALRHTAQNMPQAPGAGSIDACATIARAAGTCVCACLPVAPPGRR